MTFTPQQFSQIAEGYDKAATDPKVAAETRAEFAKKAEWFHFLARREERTQPRLAEAKVDPIDWGVSGKCDPPARLRRSMSPFLTTLWLAGAGVYLISTVLFTNAVNLFGSDDPQQAVQTSQSADTPVNQPKFQVIASPEEKERQPEPVAEDTLAPPPIKSDGITPAKRGQGVIEPALTRHAISPDQAPYESPTLTVPPLPLQEGQRSPPQSVPDSVVSPSLELLRVTAPTTVRNGPSTNSKKIGTATAGAELQVKSRQNDWVEFIEPSSGNSGWIHSSLLAPAVREAKDETLPPAAATPTEEGAKMTVTPLIPKLAKKPNGKAMPKQITQRQRTYVQLPADEDFTPLKRRGMGLSTKRLLREGLMSPNFQPPD
jgi:hypothetical protein